MVYTNEDIPQMTFWEILSGLLIIQVQNLFPKYVSVGTNCHGWLKIKLKQDLIAAIFSLL